MIPRAAIGAQPFQDIQLPIAGGRRTGFLIPRTASRSRPLQAFELAVLRGLLTGGFIPGTTVGITNTRMVPVDYNIADSELSHSTDLNALLNRVHETFQSFNPVEWARPSFCMNYVKC
jgi:hypothetical protein